MVFTIYQHIVWKFVNTNIAIMFPVKLCFLHKLSLDLCTSYHCDMQTTRAHTVVGN